MGSHVCLQGAGSGVCLSTDTAEVYLADGLRVTHVSSTSASHGSHGVEGIELGKIIRSGPLVTIVGVSRTLEISAKVVA